MLGIALEDSAKMLVNRLERGQVGVLMVVIFIFK